MIFSPTSLTTTMTPCPLSLFITTLLVVLAPDVLGFSIRAGRHGRTSWIVSVSPIIDDETPTPMLLPMPCNYENPTVSRRSWIIQRGAPVAVCAVAFFQHPLPIKAKYGDASSMELPSYIEYLIEKNSVIDESQVLYRGADPAVLLQRLQESLKRLNEIPELADQKKWTQINGLVTGPLGTLSQTLNQIVTLKSSSSSSSSAAAKSTAKVQEAARKVKADVLAIGQAADKKNPEGCTKQAALASQDLKTLLQVAFE